MAQKLMFPMKTLSVSQGYGIAVDGVSANTFSHKATKCLDINGADTGKDYGYAPCDCKVVRIYNGQTASSKCNFVFFESLAPVELRTKGLNYVTWIMAHSSTADLNTLGIHVGATFKQGEQCYREGMAGNATGNHIHICMGIGKFSGTGWHSTSAGTWEVNNSFFIHQECWIAPDTKIRNTGGYKWETLKETAAPAGDPKPKPAPSTSTTFKKGDAVKLVADKLYTSSTGTGHVIKTTTYYIYDGQKVNGRYRVTNNKTWCSDTTFKAAHVSGWINPDEVETVGTTTTPTPAATTYIGKPIAMKGAKLYASSKGTAGFVKYTTYYLYDNINVNGRYRVTNTASHVKKGAFNAAYISGWVDAAVAKR